MMDKVQRVSVDVVNGGPYEGKIMVAVGSSKIAMTKDEAVAVLRLMPRNVIHLAGLRVTKKAQEDKEDSKKEEPEQTPCEVPPPPTT